MSNRLTGEQRRRYESEGLLFPIPVLSPDEARRYCLACDDLEARLGGKPRTVEVRQMHLHFAWAHELATHPLVLDAVEDVLGPNLLVWATELFAKHPQDKVVSIGWHRDRPYVGLAPETTTTAWIALSGSSAANGCMRAVPGPARHEPQPAGRPLGPKAIQVDERQVVEVVLRPGEMSLHDTEIVHGSSQNRSGEKRVGFVVRFVAPEARPLHGRPPAILARGRDDRGHFHLVGPPVEADAERALAGMRESASFHFDAVLQNLRLAAP